MQDLLALLEAFFGEIPKLSLPAACSVVILVALVLGAVLAGVTWSLLKVIEGWKALQEIIPRFSEGARARAFDRRRFARHIESELQSLADLDNWHDSRFAELEADVEAEGRTRNTLASVLGRRVNGLRREKSLSSALHRAKDRLILLQGEPGAGKSVALRHLAQRCVATAVRSSNPDSLIPVYINLKDFDVAPERVNPEAVRQFVLRSLNAGADHEIDSFLRTEFDNGLRRGTWLFLFDSFDEIPAVLSAIEPKGVVLKFAQAIDRFLGGMNTCRGLLASREFRGPTPLSWPRFRILRLSETRQRRLIRKAGLAYKQRETLRLGMHLSASDVSAMLSNPMFLAMLCEYVKTHDEFPRHSHSVYDSYVSDRLERHEARMSDSFKLNATSVKLAAQDVAFAMTASTIGLNPTRAQLTEALCAMPFQPTADLPRHLDALQYLKLARPDSGAIRAGRRHFTFSHRRFQEYFATLRVLREPRLVRPRQLLLDGRWRETAVVLLQTQSLAAVKPVIDTADSVLAPLDHDATSEHSGERLHVLGILQDGFIGRAAELPVSLRNLAEQVVVSIDSGGSLADRRVAIEHAGVIPVQSLARMIQLAFDSGSRWLQESAFLQIARLPALEDGMKRAVLELLQERLLSGRLYADRFLLRAQLQRIRQSQDLLRVCRLYIAIPAIDTAMHLACFLFIGQAMASLVYDPLTLVSLIFMLGTALFVSRRLLTSGLHISTVERMRGIAGFVPLIACGVLLSKQEAATAGAELALVFLFLPAALWTPVSVSAAVRNARFARPVFWPVLPLIELIRKILSIRWAAVWRLVKSVTPGLLIGVAGWGVWKINPSAAALALNLFMAALGIAIVVAVLDSVVSGLRYILHRIALVSVREVQTAQSIEVLLAQRKDYHSRADLITHLRERSLFPATAEMVAFLGALARNLDDEVALRRQEALRTPGTWIQQIRLFARRNLKHSRRHHRSSHTEDDPHLLDYRDEVFRSFEQVCAAAAVDYRTALPCASITEAAPSLSAPESEPGTRFRWPWSN